MTTIEKTINPHFFIKELALSAGVYINNGSTTDSFVKSLLAKSLDSSLYIRVIEAWLSTNPSLFDIQKRINCLEGQIKKNGKCKNKQALVLLKEYNKKQKEPKFFYNDFWNDLSNIDEVLPCI